MLLFILWYSKHDVSQPTPIVSCSCHLSTRVRFNDFVNSDRGTAPLWRHHQFVTQAWHRLSVISARPPCPGTNVVCYCHPQVSLEHPIRSFVLPPMNCHPMWPRYGVVWALNYWKQVSANVGVLPCWYCLLGVKHGQWPLNCWPKPSVQLLMIRKCPLWHWNNVHNLCMQAN